MAEEYASLELLVPINTDKGPAKELVVVRPTAGVMARTLDVPSQKGKLTTFIEGCVYARVNGDARIKFKPDELNAVDGGEIASIVIQMGIDADEVAVPEADGDGVSTPIIYTLQHPIHMGKEQGDVIEQIEFRARTLGEISRYLDSTGRLVEFREFMRGFGTLLGTKLPMTDGIIDALDFVDYLVIRDQIMGKLVRSRGRWKRTSTPLLQ